MVHFQTNSTFAKGTFLEKSSLEGEGAGCSAHLLAQSCDTMRRRPPVKRKNPLTQPRIMALPLSHGVRGSGSQGPRSSARWRRQHTTRALTWQVQRGRTELPLPRSCFSLRNIPGGPGTLDTPVPEGRPPAREKRRPRRPTGGRRPPARWWPGSTGRWRPGTRDHRVLNRARFPQAQHALLTLKQARGYSLPPRGTECPQGAHLAGHGAREPRGLDRVQCSAPRLLAGPSTRGDRGSWKTRATSRQDSLEESAALGAT